MTPFTRRAFLGTLTAAGGLAVTGLPAHADSAPAGSAHAGSSSRRWRSAAEDVRAELRHAWGSYRRYAWGHDQLLPGSGGYSEFFDSAHPVGLSIVEALGTLYFMGLDDELDDGVRWVRDQHNNTKNNADVQ